MEVTYLTPQRMVKWLPFRKFHGQSLLGHKERLKIGGSLSFPSPSSGWFTAWLQATPKHRIISLKAQLKSGAGDASDLAAASWHANMRDNVAILSLRGARTESEKKRLWIPTLPCLEEAGRRCCSAALRCAICPEGGGTSCLRVCLWKRLM